MFGRFLGLNRHELAVYSFPDIYIWKGLFDIYWAIIEDSLCVFFKDRIGCFLYLPPQSRQLSPQVVTETFRIMDGFNRNKDISRIENVEEGDLRFYNNLGYDHRYKSCDYIYQNRQLIQLKGDKFKSKRASCNYFTGHYSFKYLPFSNKHKEPCLALYDIWMRERKDRSDDPVYRGMLEDSRDCFKILLNSYSGLGLTGRLVEVEGEIRGATFGFPLDRDTFCILYEITDLSFKGLSQFIFRAFCEELESYRYVNAMDDSGLANLKKVKLSYRPIRTTPAYIVERKNE